MLCSLATRLDPDQIQEIESLAQDMGTPILAFACHQSDAAPLDAAQIDRLVDLENRLGVALVAVRQ
jgi:sugar phosphate isomerase/epimerase